MGGSYRCVPVLVILWCGCCGCGSIANWVNPPAPDYEIASSTMSVFSTGAAASAEGTEGENRRPSFCVYVYTDDRSEKNHFSPSGWMGDVQDLKFSGSYQKNPRVGRSCLRITYLAKGPKQWAGIYWQNPANNWGNVKGGYDLHQATALTFWARGEQGGEKIAEFKLGGLTGKNADSDVASIGPVKLKKDWTQYRIDVRDRNLQYISGGFCFTVLARDNPSGCTFYLDEIRYE